jgi:hypothetical protein
MAKDDFSKGYERALKEARPVIELEHRVNSIESRVKVLTWAGVIGVTISTIMFIVKLPIFKNFFGRKADEKEFLRWKEEQRRAEIEDNMLERNATDRINAEFVYEGKVRRHARDFVLERYDVSE